MFKINSIDKAFKFDGKILKKSGKKYTGSFFVKLNKSKTAGLKYEKGLLKLSSMHDAEGTQFKTYSYDKRNKLINIKKNNKDIFTKNIKHNIGLAYTRDEIINDIISKTFDSKNRLIKYVISPKLIFGFIKYFKDLSIETRYFLNLARYNGNGQIVLKNNYGDPILNNGIIDKTIIRMKNGSKTIISGEPDNLKGQYINPQGKNGPTIHFMNDSKGNPVWTRVLNSENKPIFEKKINYDDFGNKKREIFSDYNGKCYTESLFDEKENIIVSKRLNSKAEEIQKIEYVYNEKNLIIEEKTFNRYNKLVESTHNTYYPNGKVKICETTYYDNLGSYKNIYEYSPKGKLKKLTEIYNDSDLKFETYYDRFENEKLYIEKDLKNNIIRIKKYINKKYDKVKTIVKNPKNKEIYHIEHSRKINGDIMENTNIYKTPSNNLLGTETIIHNNETEITEYIYLNSKGEKIDYETMCKIVGDEI